MSSIANRGRPAGEVRQAVVRTFAEHGALPLCDLAAASNVGSAACSYVVKNMMRAEQLEVVGHVKREHSKKWVALYSLAEVAPADVVDPGIVLLDDMLRAWR